MNTKNEFVYKDIKQHFQEALNSKELEVNLHDLETGAPLSWSGKVMSSQEACDLQLSEGNHSLFLFDENGFKYDGFMNSQGIFKVVVSSYDCEDCYVLTGAFDD